MAEQLQKIYQFFITNNKGLGIYVEGVVNTSNQLDSLLNTENQTLETYQKLLEIAILQSQYCQKSLELIKLMICTGESFISQRDYYDTKKKIPLLFSSYKTCVLNETLFNMSQWLEKYNIIRYFLDNSTRKKQGCKII